MQFTIPGIPVPQPRQRVAVRFGHATTYTPAAHPVNAFKATARIAAAEARAISFNGPVAVRAEFVLPKPASRVKKRDAGRLIHTATKPDLDNLMKSLLDALTGLCWHDDAQVARMEVLKRYVVTDATGAAIEQARTIVEIESLTAAPSREEAEVERLRSDLEVIRGVPCYCGPDGEPGPPDLGAYLDAVKERDEALLRINQLETECGHLQADKAELRGLLREACEKLDESEFIEVKVVWLWDKWQPRATAALEGKQ